MSDAAQKGHEERKMKYLSLILASITLGGLLSGNASSDGMTCITETGLLVKREIRDGYSVDQVQKVLKSHGLQYTYVSREEVNKVIGSSAAPAENKGGAEFLIRVPITKQARLPQVVHEFELVVIKLDYYSNKVILVECRPLRVGP